LTTPDVDVAVIGGGIAGLSAAWELQRRGARFVLLEAGPRWGGVIRTERADGFLLEGGPDALLAQKPEAERLCRALGLGERIVPTNPSPRAVYVLRRGALHRLPDGMILGVPTRLAPLAATRLLSWPGKLRMAADLVLPRRRAAADESIAAFFRRRLGRQALERLGAPLLAGIHAGDAERLSVQATFPRLVELEGRHGSLIRGFMAARARTGPAAPPFFSLTGGLAEITGALVAALPADRLRRHAPVRSVRREAGGYVLEAGVGPAIRAAGVVLAIPAPVAAGLVEPLDGEAAALLAGIPFVSTAVVCLGFRREHVAHPLDGYGLVAAGGERLRTTACGFFSTKFPGRAPGGHVSLRAFLGSARDPDVLAMTDAELIQTALAELAPALGLSAPPVLTRVFRWPGATPQMQVGHLARVAALEARLAGMPGVAITAAGVRATGIPDTIADARLAAAAVLDAIGRNNVPSGTYREADDPTRGP
jgi:oxygen-dependent protoporphyrinogen oxidase